MTKRRGESLSFNGTGQPCCFLHSHSSNYNLISTTHIVILFFLSPLSDFLFIFESLLCSIGDESEKSESWNGKSFVSLRATCL